PENKLDLIMILIVGVLILIYIWLLERAGFLITTIFFLFVTTLVLGYRRHIVNLIVSISIPVVFYYSFSYLLEISLPKGILPFLIRGDLDEHYGRCYARYSGSI